MNLATSDVGSAFGDVTPSIDSVDERTHPASVHNVADVERVASVVLGALLVGAGVKRRDIGGALAALTGGLLIHRGATGHCMVYERLGVSTGDADAVLTPPRRDVTGRAATVNARKAVRIEARVTIAAPRPALHAFWRNFENLPRIMEHVQEVTELSETRSHWKARGAAGQSLEWDAELVNDLPGRLIAWKTIGHPDIAHAGSVHFDDAPGGGTAVRVVFEYEPPGGRVGHVLARLLGEDPERELRNDLMNLKTLFEQPQKADSTQGTD